MKYFLGVDIGNTKSHALIADENGKAIGFGRSGPGSWEAVGWDGAREVLRDITDQVLYQAGISKAVIAGAGFGFAGYDWPEDHPGHEKLIDSLDLVNAATAFGNDTLVGLLAGANEGKGVVVVAGTSNNCRGRDECGREGRVTGQGSWFGEYGGANELVNRGIQAVALSWTQRGPATELRDAFIAATGAQDVEDLLAGLVRGRYSLSSDNAPIIFDLAATGDSVAQEIILWAGRELGSLANGVIRQLGFETQDFDVILSGSVYKGNPSLIHSMQETIHSIAPGARLVRLTAPPVIGGVLLGMEQVGLDTIIRRQTLIHSTNELLQKT